jgi:hypothetical protein
MDGFSEQGEVPDTNWSRAFDFMDSHPDRVVRSLLRLVYGRFIHDGLEGLGPPETFDLLYCFQLLDRAFSFKEALANAIKGEYGEGPLEELDWNQRPSRAARSVSAEPAPQPTGGSRPIR